MKQKFDLDKPINVLVLRLIAAKIPQDCQHVRIKRNGSCLSALVEFYTGNQKSVDMISVDSDQSVLHSEPEGEKRVSYKYFRWEDRGYIHVSALVRRKKSHVVLYGGQNV